MPPIPYHVLNEHAYEPVVVWNGAGTGLSGTRLLVADEHPRREIAAAQPGCPRKTPGADILGVLVEGPHTSLQIAEALGRQASALNRALWTLEQAGHVVVHLRRLRAGKFFRGPRVKVYSLPGTR